MLDQFRDGTAQAPGLSRQPRPLVEQWAHEASFVPPQTWLHFTFGMAAPRHQVWADDFSVKYPGLLDSVRDAIEQLGPMTARDLASVARSRSLGMELVGG
ncbi:DNA glycosylase AlkZ-like family protein [Ornithinimicrobium sp. INDO-MA30-4]|uniref:DNA glycosylase AlkZ-like family protein n=1 Tax=Ornithinimicrobium sp. INDO-MA30-4 TaxID=2908651 RepID=UPI001F288D57|nr:crosslink repair DNA glycosylase YcaQ family protein [Ornithinimicrobium sp. INDO-MA30-4]UJH71413.1 winged helix DNA-binding domain-containing protein [Ornithinimicrobium sp. INDO-MA30-4]